MTESALPSDSSDKMDNPSTEVKPNRWPIVLFSIPFAAVLFGILMVSVALKFPDDVVVDQYYKEGMAINQRIADTEMAKRLGIHAVIQLDDPYLTSDIVGSTDSVFELTFHHVTDESRDFNLRLARQGNQYTALESVPGLKALQQPGVWYAELTDLDKTWRIQSRLQTPIAELVLGNEASTEPQKLSFDQEAAG